MKLTAISDIHGDLMDLKDLPEGDVLIIAGDILPDDYHPSGRDQVGTTRIDRQGWWFDQVFIPYLALLRTKFEHVIFSPGNHDFFFAAVMISGVTKDLPPGVHYLSETSVEINGVRFFGAGWNCTRGWAFAFDEEDHARKLKEVPSDTDVLIVHGPPYRADFEELTHFTSPVFGLWLKKQNHLQAVICGHVHEAFGFYPGKPPLWVVSVKNRLYRTVNPATQIEVTPHADPTYRQ